ncbi:sulfatase-like hydrolase/transferase [Natrinema halophilum]|uniref:Sulfatase-like hydrolase/transferase n=1 Tax=Natrinema halophilum TaxID=1699371 RepID=A0A7D5GH86_9EURY|nr:sulfatase-like hydrolase/transferase [Natrinema halophilum]QLG48887.1 sulfatase-like hydrolase/transferase [Natrinema halophilum]
MVGSLIHLLKWGARHTRDGIERSLSPSDFREINDRVYAPSWIRSNSPKCYVRVEPRPDDEYFAVRRSLQTKKDLYPIFTHSNGEQSVSIAPPEEFNRVDAEIVDIINADAILLEAIFTHPNGQTSEKSVEYNIQDAPLHEGNTLPVSISVSEPAIEAHITLRKEISNDVGSLFVLPEKIRQYDWKANQNPQLSLPVPRGQDGTPIFLISVDTFRYDALDKFEPVLELLGDDAVIPSEPRTQGHWTRPAHASMFTGVHPGVHGYVGTGSENKGQYGIHPDLVTIPEILSDNMYKCSGCVTKDKTGVEYGFGRGMHRYAYKPISWNNSNYDGADIVDQVIQWLDRDHEENSKRLFYFLHLFDPHYPYLPTVSSKISPVDFDTLETLNSYRSVDNYLEVIENPPKMSDDEINLIKSYYYQSVSYAANQINRLINYLKHIGLYSESFLIITGDHGEDFLEREFAGHNSVTDANIRPGMIIKPPDDTDINIPDEADIIDFLPTIAELVGEDPPKQSDGVAWQNTSKADMPRITERVRPDWYTISLEKDSVKAVYTYNDNYPEYPTKSQVENGPIDVRYYDTSSRVSGEPLNNTCPPQYLVKEIEDLIENHISTHRAILSSTPNEEVQTSGEVEQRLKHLGYK